MHKIYNIVVPRGTIFYLPNKINRTLISAGETPGILLAIPIVGGFILLNFCLASVDKE